METLVFIVALVVAATGLRQWSLIAARALSRQQHMAIWATSMLIGIAAVVFVNNEIFLSKSTENVVIAIISFSYFALKFSAFKRTRVRSDET